MTVLSPSAIDGGTLRLGDADLTLVGGCERHFGRSRGRSPGHHAASGWPEDVRLFGTRASARPLPGRRPPWLPAPERQKRWVQNIEVACPPQACRNTAGFLQNFFHFPPRPHLARHPRISHRQLPAHHGASCRLAGGTGAQKSTLLNRFPMYYASCSSR